ncbi:flagellar basal body P-ring formation protein FlgA [Trinickia terrae]|uniref:Flagellar basal body P-ring formation protein FlgA n=1 Tax=Trinickia terrae TaxID=2571161 RepID=A0A4U1I787_9BURK|nr:flagellar basal body P-ring formation chaperone FlgA [Trinickia terrae]TKC89259.1 flagellar basal body P-ring formation protein FlgA [Trinickia terrae]
MFWPATDVTRRDRTRGADPRRARAGAARTLRRWALVSACLAACGGLPALAAAQTEAQAGSGPIVIPGPGETNPAALQAMAQSAGMTASAPAPVPPAPPVTPVTRSASRGDDFANAAAASGAIVIPGPGERGAQGAAANSYANNVPAVTIPAPVERPAASTPAINNAMPRESAAVTPRQMIPVIVASAPYAARQAAQPVAMSAPADAVSIDPLSARGEPPEIASGANPHYVVRTARPANAASAAPAQTTMAAAAAPASPAAPAAVARAAAQQPARPAQQIAAPAPAGQQDGESIRQTAIAFLQQQAQGLPGRVAIQVNQVFPRGLAACASLEPFMPMGSRMWGRTMVGVRCVGDHPWTLYLQARVAVQGTYYLAARPLSPGDVLSAADLVVRDGDLTALPQAVITDPSQAVGATALVRISEGLPLRQDILKGASAVTVGQTVRIVAVGQGFSISAEGSAMNNASPGQTVRVKTVAGQIIQGVVKDGGTVEIQL